ncbi:MAG: Nif3-like dinuclear metal center hexameric protein [Clostridia bacterium]
MVTLKELISFLEETAPPALAEDYDNVGLLVEGADAKIHTLLLALDADEKTVEQAGRAGAELIVSHHPLIFKPLNCLTESEGGQRTVRRLIQKGIGLYALHTNFDSAEGGLCDAFLDCFGSFQSRCSFSGEQAGIGRIGQLTEPCTLAELLERVRKALGPDMVSYVGNLSDRIETVAACNGGGGDLVYEAHRLGAQVYVSGDFKHHHARFACENGLRLINISHFDAEIGFCRLLQSKLTARFGQRLQILCSEETNPWQCYES